MKNIPHWSLLHAFRLSKIESTIEHLLSWSRQKSMMLQLILPHMVDHTFMAFPLPLQTL